MSDIDDRKRMEWRWDDDEEFSQIKTNGKDQGDDDDDDEVEEEDQQEEDEENQPPAKMSSVSRVWKMLDVCLETSCEDDQWWWPGEEIPERWISFDDEKEIRSSMQIEKKSLNRD